MNIPPVNVLDQQVIIIYLDFEEFVIAILCMLPGPWGVSLYLEVARNRECFLPHSPLGTELISVFPLKVF